MSHPAPIKTHQCHLLALRMKWDIHYKAFLHLTPTYLTHLSPGLPPAQEENGRKSHVQFTEWWGQHLFSCSLHRCSTLPGVGLGESELKTYVRTLLAMYEGCEEVHWSRRPPNIIWGYKSANLLASLRFSEGTKAWMSRFYCLWEARK